MAKPTAAEQARIDQLRAQVAELGLPEGVSIDFVVLDPDEQVEQIADADAAVFAPASQFGDYMLDDGTVVPCAEVSGLDWLEELVVTGRVGCDYYGIVKELEGVDIGMQGHFRLRIQPNGTAVPLFVSFEKASDGWRQRALRRFAVAWPERPDGKRAYIATGPMQQFAEPLQMPGRGNREKGIGRNDPCPCGSGVKFKRCHGA